MKKILSIVLLLAMCLSLFAACGEKEDNSGLEAAKQFVHASYVGASANTPVDYKIMGVSRVGDVEYKVEWTASSDKITFTRGEDKFVTVHVPNDNLEDIKYTLTGTISDDKGNSLTVTFDRVVPARAGIPTDVTTGTYVIVWENVTFSSLTADKSYGYAPFNNVTVADGTVTGHFKADVLTLTAVEGGFTIQDAHGRYVYMKGTYNSFNVGAEAPEDGHIWQLLTDKDGKTFIVNKMNMKTLAYDTGYSSWGAYPEITDARKSQVTLIAATAPETDPETPSTPDTPDVPSQPAGEVETPVAGTAYKLGLVHGGKGNAMMYFTGVSKPNYPWYMLSTQNVAEAIDVFVEEVEGGLRLYFTIDGTKTYLDMHKDDTHYSLRLTTEPTAVYTWNTEYKTFVATVEDKECFIGTSGTYDTFSCNKMEFVATSYVAHLYGEGGAATPDEPEKPTEKPGTLAEQIAEANKLANKAYLSYESTITGTITDEPKASDYTPGTYKFTVSDGTNSLLCYFVPVTGGTPKKGDTITVTGKLTAYNGAAQFDSTAKATLAGGAETPDEPEKPTEKPATLAEQIAEANKLANKAYLSYESTITGTITDEPKASDYTPGTYKFTVSDGTNSLLCYFVPVTGGTPKKGDTITVTGKLTAYNGAAQFDSTATATLAGGTETPDEPEKPEEPSTSADATITFADKANRTTFNEEQQVWKQNGITVTNDKAASKSPVADYANPARFYQASKLTIECTGMKSIKIHCDTKNKPVKGLTDSLAGIEGITVSVDGDVVTITFASATDVFVIDSLAAQIRVAKIEVFK